MNLRGRLPFFAVATALSALLAWVVKDALRFESAPPQTMAAPAATPGSAREVLTRGGAARDLSRPPGRLLLVHFWATWCVPCADELPGLVAYAREIRKTPGVELLTISVDESWKTVDAWLKARKADDLPVALDPKQEAARRFGTSKFPETWILAPSGEVLEHIVGPMDWTSRETRRFLDELVRAVKGPDPGARERPRLAPSGPAQP